jgi:uncharacterized membrane protein YgcG
MLQSQYGVLSVRAKTDQVVDYHHDEQQPGRPLYLLVPGGLLALVSLILMFWIAYATWYQVSLPRSTGLIDLLLLAPVYAGSVFLFSYAYELYNLPKAMHLTLILVFLSFAAVIICGVLFALLNTKDSESSSSSSKSSSGRAGSTSFRSGGGGSSFGGGSFDMNYNGPRVGTREVVHEVPAEAAPVICAYCGTSYVPAAIGALTCPHCGASAPAASQAAT